MSREHNRAILLLIVCSLLWSTGGLLLKKVDWPPLAVAGGRGLIAAVFLMACLRRVRLRFDRYTLFAALAYAATTILFATANKYTTAANAILLQYTAPVYIALFGAWLLGERATRLDWATIVVVLGGMALFFFDDLDASHVTGNVIAIVGGVCFAAMTLLLRKQKDGSPIDSIILGNLIAATIGLPWMVRAPLPSPVGIASLVALGTLQLGVSYLLYSYAIKRVTALEAVLIPVIEPILNPVWVMLLLGERPGRNALIGGAIVLGAVTVRALIAIRDRQVAGAAPAT